MIDRLIESHLLPCTGILDLVNGIVDGSTRGRKLSTGNLNLVNGIIDGVMMID